jgi:hypothetical protein
LSESGDCERYIAKNNRYLVDTAVQYIAETTEDLLHFLREVGRYSGRFYFRGQKSKYQSLATTIERRKNKFTRDILHRYEHAMIRAYQQRVHHHVVHYPDRDMLLDWLSLIQHYGGPTRLLDLTQSLFVAVFFAVHQNEECDGDVFVLHALDSSIVNYEFKHRDYLQKAVLPNPQPRWEKVSTETDWSKIRDDREILGINPRFVNQIISGDIDLPGVVLVQPFYLNRRLIVQQGLFALPFTLKHSFEENLIAMFDSLPAQKEPCRLINAGLEEFLAAPVMQFRIPRDSFMEFRYFLRQMNITMESMFPDFDGLTQSLKEHIPSFNFENSDTDTPKNAT